MDQWHSKQLRLQVHEKPSSPMSKSNPIPTSNPNPNSNPMTRVQTASWPFFTSLAIPTSNPNPNSNPMTRVSTASHSGSGLVFQLTACLLCKSLFKSRQPCLCITSLIFLPNRSGSTIFCLIVNS